MRVVIHDYSGHAFQVQLSRELARRGHEVLHLHFAGFQAPKGALAPYADDPASLTIRALDIGEPFAKQSFVKRRHQERRYGEIALRAARAFGPDVAICSNTPLDPLGLLQRALQADGCRFVLWWQDIYSIAMGKFLPKKLPFAGRLVAAYYRHLEQRVCREADAIVCITDDFVPILDKWRVSRQKAITIENWAPLDEIRPCVAPTPFAIEQDLVNRPVLMYAGTLGLKHNPMLLWATAQRLARTQGLERGRVVVISEGMGADWLRARLAETPGVPLVILPYQPHERVGEILGTATVLAALLEPDAGVFSVPSKVLSYFAAGKPILIAAPAENLASRTVARIRAGHVVDPTDIDAFADTTVALLRHPEALAAMGARARAHAEQAFDLATIADRFEGLWDCSTDPQRLATRLCASALRAGRPDFARPHLHPARQPGRPR